MKKIGIIGLGIMGHGMALNFLKQGYEVAVWNRTQSKADDLVKLGGILLSTPKAVTEFADIVFEVVTDDEASRSVWFGDDGILAGANPEQVLITSATLSLNYLDELIAATQNAKLKFLDMPLTGSRAGAESGNLQLIMGGDKKIIESIEVDLGAISRKSYYFGKAGNGMRFKLILNSLTAIHAIAAAQAAAVARAGGLDVEAVGEALMDGMAPSSPVTGVLFQSLKTPHEQVRFSAALLEKDLRYAKEMNDNLGFEGDMLDIAYKNFAKAKHMGLGDQDWSKITELYNLNSEKSS